ncbi:MAG: hypothetical protein FVQ82_15580 [Planctomycetes bacterium]|nr:hypothetical protein [Planctomycetota bacterium]
MKTPRPGGKLAARTGGDGTRPSGSDPLLGFAHGVREIHDSGLGIDDSALGMALPLHEAEVPRRPAESLFHSTEGSL